MADATPHAAPAGARPGRAGQGAERRRGDGAPRRRAATTSIGCSSSPRACATSDGATPSRIRRRSSCRSRCSAATTVTTARSRSRPPRSTRRSSRPRRSWRSPRPAGARGARRRCSRSATGRRSGTPQARDWLAERGYALDARVPARGGDPRDRGDGAAAASEPGRDVLRGARAAQARERVDGAHARDLERSASRAGDAALRLARQGARPCGCARSRTPAGSRSRSRPASSSGSARRARERAESLFAIRDLHRRYHHVQEVIVQNFRAKAGTAMHAAPEPDDEEFLAAVATARIVLGPHVSVQAPPNLSRRGAAAAAAGRRDQRLGRGVAPDARPREPRAALAPIEALAAPTAVPGEAAPASGSPSTRGTRSSPTRGSRPRCAPRSPRSMAPDGLAADGPASRADRLAGPRGRLQAAHDRADVREGPRAPDSAPTPSRSTARSTCGGPGDRRMGTRDASPNASTPRSARRSRRRPPTGRSPTRRRSRCSKPRARRSTRSAGSPTTCAPRRSDRRSPT